jgi:hypothetical protein
MDKDGKILFRKGINCDELDKKYSCHGSVTNYVFWFDPDSEMKIEKDEIFSIGGPSLKGKIEFNIKK